MPAIAWISAAGGGGDILVQGSASLVQDKLHACLMDDIHIMLYPTVPESRGSPVAGGMVGPFALDSLAELGSGIVSIYLVV